MESSSEAILPQTPMVRAVEILLVCQMLIGVAAEGGLIQTAQGSLLDALRGSIVMALLGTLSLIFPPKRLLKLWWPQFLAVGIFLTFALAYLVTPRLVWKAAVLASDGLLLSAALYTQRRRRRLA